jgi:hypothetical protein
MTEKILVLKSSNPGRNSEHLYWLLQKEIWNAEIVEKSFECLQEISLQEYSRIVIAVDLKHRSMILQELKNLLELERVRNSGSVRSPGIEDSRYILFLEQSRKKSSTLKLLFNSFTKQIDRLFTEMEIKKESVIPLPETSAPLQIRDIIRAKKVYQRLNRKLQAPSVSTKMPAQQFLPEPEDQLPGNLVQG